MSVYSWTLARIGVTRRVVPDVTRKRISRANVFRLLVLITVLGIVAAVYFLRDLADLSKTGYLAIAALSFFASAGLVVPVPGIASVCAGGLLLGPPLVAPLLVALVAGTTGTVGELTGYALGFSGRGVVHKSRLYLRIENWMRRRGWLVLFALSVLPNPIFDLAGVAAGALRYPIWRFLGIIWVGTFIKFLILAYACDYGADDILKLFGVGIT